MNVHFNAYITILKVVICFTKNFFCNNIRWLLQISTMISFTFLCLLVLLQFKAFQLNRTQLHDYTSVINISSRDVKQRLNFRTSNYMFKLEFGIVTFDIRFHLALS